jgi:hypothetical protein
MAEIEKGEPADFNQARRLCPYLIARHFKKRVTLSLISESATLFESIAQKFDTDPTGGCGRSETKQLLKKATLTLFIG